MENTIETYHLKKRNILVIVVASIAALLLGFVFNFSFEDKIKSLIVSNLKKNRKCPISYKDLKVSMYLPSIKLNKVNVSRRCLRTNQDISLKKISTSFSMPSLSPLGPALSTVIQDKHSKINISSVHGITNHYINLKTKKLSTKTLNPFLGKLKLAGNFSVDTNVDMDLKRIKEMDLLVKSKDFTIPPQTIQSFNIPSLKIGNVLLKAQIKKKDVLEIKNMVLGKELSPIRAKVTGKIIINKHNFGRSKLDLTANVKFSASFIDKFAILNLFLDKTKQDKQGFYKMKITGTVSRPAKPTFL